MAFLDQFPQVIANLIQQKFLVRELEEGLDSVLAYRKLALRETFPGRIGETMTRTRKGRRAPVYSPLNPANFTNFDNGLPTGSNQTQFAIEQYAFTLAAYGDSVDLNLMQSEGQIADQFIANARNNGVQAAQSLERICRLKLFNAYMGGNTRVIAQPSGSIISNGAANSTTNINVDDIRGFLSSIVNGAVTPVGSGTAAIPIQVTDAAGNVQNSTVTATTQYLYQTGHTAVEISNTPDAVLPVAGGTTIPNPVGGPGFLTITPALSGTPAANATVTVNTSPLIIRPFNRFNTALITPSDVLSLGLIEDAVAYMRDNGVPPMDDGTFHCIMDNTSMRQLYADQDFKILYAGRYQSSEFKEGEIVKLAGVTYIPTTEAYLQGAIAAGNPKVRRPIIVGAESIIQANFEGMQTWLSGRGFDRNDSNIAVVDDVVQIIREPLDRYQQIIAQSWEWIGDFAVPTDLTANNSVIPTASNSQYKRAVIIEHAG